MKSPVKNANMNNGRAGCDGQGGPGGPGGPPPGFPIPRSIFI